MLTSTENNIFSSKNYLKEKQTINSLFYQESGQIIQQGKFQLTTDQVNLTYNPESITTYDSSMSLKSNARDGYNLLRGLVLNIFKKQGLDSTITADDPEIDLSTIATDEAQELISEDGYFGVEKTSDRIFRFAVGMAGGDPTRINAILEGVENGFKEALDAFGGWLPDISYDTYDTVMNKLDGWAGVDNSPQSQA